MNERIEKLARQANPDIFKEFDQEDIDFCKKFAELLIQECAHLVGGYVKENEFGTDVKEAYEEITKHFGVEQ